MKFLIIEDEPYAAQQLQEMITAYYKDAVFYPIIDSVEDAVSFLKKERDFDLIFLDIHLSDGQAFEIFESVQTNRYIIFTTAYDQYALKAFGLNSVDYLLKPIQKDKLEKALQKFENNNHSFYFTKNELQRLKQILSGQKIYKENFLVAFKDKWIPVSVESIAFFEIKNGVVVGIKFDKSVVVFEERSLEDLASQLNPHLFFRANRQYLVSRKAIKEITQYFNGKILLSLSLEVSDPIVISREKSSDFKQWMGK
ncbi:LytTR family DNA-binding domain-containing protein [Weeksellaceae bacterium A-14]